MARDIVVKIIGDPSSLERGFRRAEVAAEKNGRALSGLAKHASLAGGIITGGLTVALGKSVDAAQEAQASQARLADALSSAGISLQAHGAAINDVIQRTSKLAALDDEDLQDAFSKLVRTSGNLGQSLEGVSIAANLARGRHLSLEAATKVVERAMEGQAGALRKVGVEAEKGATSTELLAALQQKFAGAAESYGNTSAGAADRYKVSVENLQESLGQTLLPALTAVTSAGARLAAFFAEHTTLTKVLIGVIGSLGAALLTISAATKAYTIASKLAAAAQLALNLAMSLNPIGVVITALAALGVALAIAWEKSSTFRAIVRGAFDAVKEGVELLLLPLRAQIAAFKWIGENAVEIFKSVAKGLAPLFAFLAAIMRPVLDLLNAIRGAIRFIIDKVDEVAAKVGKVGGILSSIGGALGHLPGFASGGPVSAGRPFVVGEEGPELFVPGVSGTIVPATRGDSLAPFTGGGGDLHVHVSAGTVIGGDLDRVARELAEPIRRELLKLKVLNVGSRVAGPSSALGFA